MRRGCRYFGLRLWDYRGLFLNLDGIICLRSILSFALLGFHDLLEPTVDRMVRRIRPSVLQAASLRLMFAADCLFSALFRTPIHDEVVIDAGSDKADLDDVIRIMSQVPSWAEGLPLNADGWVNDFFKKD